MLIEDHVRNTPLRQTTFCWKYTTRVAGSTEGKLTEYVAEEQEIWQHTLKQL